MQLSVRPSNHQFNTLSLILNSNVAIQKTCNAATTQLHLLHSGIAPNFRLIALNHLVFDDGQLKFEGLFKVNRMVIFRLKTCPSVLIYEQSQFCVSFL